MKNWKVKLGDFVRRYYKDLDDSIALEGYDQYFDWQDYKIVNNGHIMSTAADYADWYSEVLKTMADKKHTLKTCTMTEEGDLYKVHIDIHFTCQQIDLTTGGKSPVVVNGQIDWLVKRDESQQGFKIKEYLVTI
jgi:hypothetical protein